MYERFLVKGKQTSDNTWVYGYPYSDGKQSYIAYEGEKDCIIHEVMPETMSRHINMKDKHNKKIFEKDIILLPNHSLPAVIEWDEITARFIANVDNRVYEINVFLMSKSEIIGNIFDNFELLDK